MIARKALGLTCLLMLPPSLGSLGCGGDDDDDDQAADGAADDDGPDDDGGSDDTDETPIDPEDGSDDSSDDGEPPCGVALGTAPSSAEDAVAGAGAIYFLENSTLDEIRVHRVDRETGAVDLLAALDAADAVIVRPKLAVDDASVYVAAAIGLWRIPITGGEPVQLVADAIDDLAQDETHLYWSTVYPGGGEDFDQQLRRMPKTGGDPEILFDEPGGSTALALDAVIAVDDTHLYWNDAVGDLRRIPKAGGEPEDFADLAPFLSEMRDLVSEPGGFYWFTSETLIGGRVYDYFHLEVDGSERLIARVTGGFVGDRLVIVGGDLYFRHSEAKDTDGLYRVSTGGGDPDRLGDDPFGAFVPTEEGIYVTGSLGLELLPVDGCAL